MNRPLPKVYKDKNSSLFSVFYLFFFVILCIPLCMIHICFQFIIFSYISDILHSPVIRIGEMTIGQEVFALTKGGIMKCPVCKRHLSRSEFVCLRCRTSPYKPGKAGGGARWFLKWSPLKTYATRRGSNWLFAKIED